MASNTSTDDTASKARKRGKPRRKRLRRALIITFVVVPLLLIGASLFLLRSEPQHWREHRAYLSRTSPQEREALAHEVGERLAKLVEDGNGEQDSPEQVLPGAEADPFAAASMKMDESHSLFLSNDEVRAFFARQFDEWMAEKGYTKPPEVKRPMIKLEEQSLVMAFEVEAEGYAQVFSARFSVVFEENEMARLRLSAFLAGQLPVPADSIGAYLRAQNPGSERLAKAGEWLGKLNEFELDPVIKTEHRRRARVRGYTITPQGITLSLRVMDHRTWRGEREALAAVKTRD